MIPAIIELPNDILTPGANANEIYTVMPFTTSVNSPRVSRMAGKARIGAVRFDLHPGLDNKSGDELF